jgi:hypothetical protein
VKIYNPDMTGHTGKVERYPPNYKFLFILPEISPSRRACRNFWSRLWLKQSKLRIRKSLYADRRLSALDTCRKRI